VFSLFVAAAGQVALVALLLGAGLPALFAVGVRSFALAGAASGAASSDATGSDAPGSDGAPRSRVPAPVLRTAGVLCFVVVVTAVTVGLTVIVATGFGQEVSFDSLVPTFSPKD
jgi:hypothetical protein